MFDFSGSENDTLYGDGGSSCYNAMTAQVQFSILLD